MVILITELFLVNINGFRMRKRRSYSFLINIKFKTLRKRQITVYKNGYIKTDFGSKLILNDCFLFINKCHFENHYNPLPSLLWLEKNSSLTSCTYDFTLCEGSRIHVRKDANIIIVGTGFINTETEIDCYENISRGKGTGNSSKGYMTDSGRHGVVEGSEDAVNSNAVRGEK